MKTLSPFLALPRFAPAGPALILILLLVLTLQNASAEEWQITYVVTQEQQLPDPQGDPAPKKEGRTYTLTLALGRQYLSVDDGHQKKIYDFTRRRFLQLNLEQHDYDDWSLYANVGSRVRELQNRHAIGAGLRAAKVAAEAGFGRFENETNLGLELPGRKLDEPKPTIARQDLPGGEWEFTHRGICVVRFIPAKAPLPALVAPRFASFLAYECSIHPDIRRQLTAADNIPALLVTHWQVGNQLHTATYRLQSVERVAGDSSALPGGFQPALHASEPLFQAVSLVRSPDGAAHRTTRAEAVRFAQEAITAQRPLDAYLALLEYMLQSGEKTPGDLSQTRPEFAKDDQCRRYFASLDQSSKEACRKSLAACESIDRTGLRKAYLLDLQRADLLQILGRGNGGLTSPVEQAQTRTAEKLFLSVLAANPFLAGAYHDLGVLYDETFRQSLAWLCFDTGRQISPGHFLLEDITGLERRFQHDFPDFF